MPFIFEDFFVLFCLIFFLRALGDSGSGSLRVIVQEVSTDPTDEEAYWWALGLLASRCTEAVCTVDPVDHSAEGGGCQHKRTRDATRAAAVSHGWLCS